MSIRVRWGARRERARRINDQLAAQDGRSRLDELDRGARLNRQASLDRLWGQTVDAPTPGRTREEIRAKVVQMIAGAQLVGSTKEGGSFARGAERELERLLAWIDGDDGD